MTDRRVRLTRAEWQALLGAVVDADGNDPDRDSPEVRRQAAARDRALAKVRDHLTTPTVRR
jgi:hypothetical protein